MNANIGDAAKVMLRNGISGLPVVNGKGNLVGIITRTDITRAKIEYSPGLQENYEAYQSILHHRYSWTLMFC